MDTDRDLSPYVVYAEESISSALKKLNENRARIVFSLTERGILEGVLTDGDLRRHMRPDLTDLLVEDVMTKNPKTIASNSLASEALKLMSSKISTLIVTDADKPVGIIHLHDLLRAGVA